MIVWLLYMSHSATSIVLAVIAIGLLVVLRLKFFRRSPRRLFRVGVAVVLALALLNAQTDVKEWLILSIGRDPDLTDRAPVWAMLLDMQPHPLIGAGYESFWSGSRMAEVWARMGSEGTGILQAHNGYIDLYLSLGLIGVSLLILAVLSGVGAIRRRLRSDYASGVLRLILVFVVLIYNYTEATFKPLNNLFVLLLYSIVQVRVHQEGEKPSMATSKDGSQSEIATRIGNPNDHAIGQNRRAGFR
jgi:O-antigen ligase